jgi:hypothetical protein
MILLPMVIAEITGMLHHVLILYCDGGFANVLPGRDLNCNSPVLYLPSSWDYKYKPLSLAQNDLFNVLVIVKPS